MFLIWYFTAEGSKVQTEKDSYEFEVFVGTADLCIVYFYKAYYNITYITEAIKEAVLVHIWRSVCYVGSQLEFTV